MHPVKGIQTIIDKQYINMYLIFLEIKIYTKCKYSRSWVRICARIKGISFRIIIVVSLT